MLDFVCFYRHFSGAYDFEAYCSWNRGSHNYGENSVVDTFGGKTVCSMSFNFTYDDEDKLVIDNDMYIEYETIGEMHMVNIISQRTEIFIVGERNALEKMLCIFQDLVQDDKDIGNNELMEIWRASCLAAQI